MTGESRNLRIVSTGGDDPVVNLRFDYLYQEHFRALYAYVLRRVDFADVADLVADVFATAWRRIDGVPFPPEDRLWLYGVARRVVTQHHRGRRRRDRLVGRLRHVRLVDLDPVEPDMALRAVELLNRLKPEDRELVRLVVWEQLRATPRWRWCSGVPPMPSPFAGTDRSNGFDAIWRSSPA